MTTFEILGWWLAVLAGITALCLLTVGTVHVVLWTLSWFWDHIMWVHPDKGYVWRRVTWSNDNGDGREARLWFAGIKGRRFGFGIMGTKFVDLTKEKGEGV